MRPPPKLTRTDTRFPYRTLFRSDAGRARSRRLPVPRAHQGAGRRGSRRRIGVLIMADEVQKVEGAPEAAPAPTEGQAPRRGRGGGGGRDGGRGGRDGGREIGRAHV